MRYYKVYAKCAYSAHPIKEIGVNEVESCISELIDYNLDEYSWSHGELDEDEWNTVTDKLATIIYKDWDASGYLNCGDYAIHRIVDGEEVPERDNMCGYDLFIDDIN